MTMQDEHTPEGNEKTSDEVVDVFAKNENDGTSNTNQRTNKPGFLSRLFDNETRLGKFLRQLVLWIIVIIICFGIGFLTAYFTIYRPVKSSLANVQATLTTLNNEKESISSKLSEAKSDLSTLQDKYDTIVVSSESLTAYINYLEFDNQLRGMMYSLASDDLATAKVMMTDAKKFLGALLPDIQAVDTDLATLIKDRLNIVSSELDMKNSEDALDDLERLRESMNLVRKALFTK